MEPTGPSCEAPVLHWNRSGAIQVVAQDQLKLNDHQFKKKKKQTTEDCLQQEQLFSSWFSLVEFLILAAQLSSSSSHMYLRMILLNSHTLTETDTNHIYTSYPVIYIK